MHHSRLCAVLIDCKTADLDEAARFWAAALGRPVDLDHPMSRDNYRMLETRSDEVIIEIQQVEHESRAHIDIETDDIPAEVRRLERLGARVVNRLERWVVMQAPTGQRFLRSALHPKRTSRPAWDRRLVHQNRLAIFDRLLGELQPHPSHCEKHQPVLAVGGPVGKIETVCSVQPLRRR